MDIVYNLEDFPFGTLSEVGITQQMLYDLPPSALDVIENGGYSPLLPIIIETNERTLRSRAKFRLVKNEEDKQDALFLWQRIAGDLSVLDAYDADARQSLLDGRAVIVDAWIPYTNEYGEVNNQKVPVYAQLDSDTNQIIMVPTAIIARNMKVVCGEYDLEADQLRRLSEGDVLTLRDSGGRIVSVGINLMTDTGVFCANCDSNTWRLMIRNPFPAYSFGAHGCWINENGLLRYELIEDFSAKTMAAQQRMLNAQVREGNREETEQIRTESVRLNHTI